MVEAFVKISEELLRNYPGIEIYDLKVSKLRNDYYIQIELDNLHHPLGAVSIDVCESFSKKFIEVLDEKIIHANGDQANHDELLPYDLQIDNYTLEVSSAGAERELKLPRDLERFKQYPMKVYHKSDSTENSMYQEKILKYVSQDEENFVFSLYIPKKERKLKKKKANLENYIIPKKDIIKINLYLDV
ncbi:MAG: hypothetical protein NZ853_08110 [Leptospiraceae bacterium]|nr:hypothetical protein [Leptospiraceae bacterium]MDW7976863.1 hypothetical protein [Leptospiraceae bacterium]